MRGMIPVACAAVTLSGCVVPIPHMRQVSPVFAGCFVDAQTGQSLEGIAVSVYGFPKTTRWSGTNGAFSVGPASKFKWGYLWTPALTHDLPGPCLDWEHRIQVQDDEYDLTNRLPDPSEPEYPESKDGIVNFGILELRKKPLEQDEAAPP